MKIEIKKINSVGENKGGLENVIKQVEEIINSEKKSLKPEVVEKINHTNWKEDILTKSSWEEAKDYGNQILALMFIQQELMTAEEAIKEAEEGAIKKSANRLEETLSSDDADLKIVLNWKVEGNSYAEKISKLLNKLVELEEGMDQLNIEDEQGGIDRWLVDEKSIRVLLEEIESLCKEKGVINEQINSKLMVKLRSSEAINYQELIKKKVYSQKKLLKWRDQLVKIVQQVALEEKRRTVMRSKPFDFSEFKKIQEDLDKLAYRDVYSKIERERENAGESPMKKTLPKKDSEKKPVVYAGKKWNEFKATFKSGKEGVERTNEKGKKGKKVNSEELAKGWFRIFSKTGLDAEGSLKAWKNGWDYKDYEETEDFVREDLPHDQKKAELGIWIQEFEKVEKEKGKEIETDEIVKWWGFSSKATGLEAKESANAWGNGWNYDEIKNGLGSISPENGESFNIPVNQEKTLAQKKKAAIMELIKFSTNFSKEISTDEEGKKGPETFFRTFYKEGIDKAANNEEVQKLMEGYVKIIAYDQVEYVLKNSTPPLKIDDLLPESQNNIKGLTDKNVNNTVEVTKKTRKDVLKDIGIVKESFDFKKEEREFFIEEIKARLELAEKNDWKVSLEKIGDKEWDKYIIDELDIRSNDDDIYKQVGDDLLQKLKTEVEKVDNEGKEWEPAFTDDDWEELKTAFIYGTSKISIATDQEEINKEEVKTINIESVVAAVKKLAIGRWKKKIEEKIGLVEEMIGQDEKDEEKAKVLMNELELIAKWDAEKDDSNQKEAFKEKRKEFYGSLELLKYESHLLAIKKVQKLSEVAEIEEEIERKMKGGYLPLGKKVSDLYQALDNQKALINLREIINNPIPAEINQINEELNKLRIHTAEVAENDYNELNKDGVVDKKELELIKAKYLKVDSQEKKMKVWPSGGT